MATENLNDRLGSVRQVIDVNGGVVKHYTYKPFGETLESAETDPNMKNPFMFTGQYFDGEIDEYFLRARMYDPHIGRFTARDPVRGKYKEPMTLHKYLYCLNDPVNLTDPSGEFAGLADVLVGQLIVGKLRKYDAGASMKIFREAVRATEVFNYTQFGKAVQTEMLLLEFQGGLTRSAVDTLVNPLTQYFSYFFSTVPPDMIAKMVTYTVGDIAAGRLTDIWKEPSFESCLYYMSYWASRLETLVE